MQPAALYIMFRFSEKPLSAKARLYKLERGFP
jgi:hypothetical protein